MRPALHVVVLYLSLPVSLSQQQKLLINEAPWGGPSQSLSRFLSDPCALCSPDELGAIRAAARATGLRGKGSAVCTGEVGTLLCTAWCTPLRQRYTLR